MNSIGTPVTSPFSSQAKPCSECRPEGKIFDAFSAAPRTSRRSMRLRRPLPATRERSIPCRCATRRARGVARTFLFTIPGDWTELATEVAESSGAGAVVVIGAASSAGSGASPAAVQSGPSPTSTRAIGAPTLTIVPSSTNHSSRLPSPRAGNSTNVLSVSTSSRTSPRLNG